MDDQQIIELYWARAENAIAETADKYGSYCRSIAVHILRDERDSEECVNDTYWKAWNTMPPQRPSHLAVFLGKITRNLSLDRWRSNTAQKRGGSQVPLALEELRDCVPHPASTEQVIDDMALADALNRFLAGLKPEARKLFLGRYWYLRSIRELAGDFGLRESKVKMSLLRSREKLKSHLEQEGINL